MTKPLEDGKLSRDRLGSGPQLLHARVDDRKRVLQLLVGNC